MPMQHRAGYLLLLFAAFATLSSAAGQVDSSKDVDVDSRDIASQIPIVHNPHTVCTNPGVRKEWRTMSREQKKSWIGAMKCLASQPTDKRLKSTGDPLANLLPVYNSSSSAFDDFAFLHADFNLRVHLTGLFFPFHRYLIWSFERSLQQRCNYTGALPYWDWTQDAGHFNGSKASIFDPDPEVGLGGFGKEEDNYVVSDGAFAHFPVSYPYPHELRRKYTPTPYFDLDPSWSIYRNVSAETRFTREEVHKAVTGFRGDYKGMQVFVEDAGMGIHLGMHLAVHALMGGDFGGECPKPKLDDRCCAKEIPDKNCLANSTPNEPFFWLHHAMVDKIWSDWQNAHPENALAFEGGSVRDTETWPKYPTGAPPAIPLNHTFITDGILVGNITIADILNTTSGAPLCYVYE